MFSRAGSLRAVLKPQKVRISSLGRRCESSSKPDNTIAPHNGRTDAQRRTHLRNGAQSDSQRKADAVEMPSLLWHQRLGALSGFFAWYDRTQSQNPYWTQLFSSLLVFFIGDQLAQGVGGEPYDGKRTLRHLAIGASISLPGYKWFIFLGNHFNYASKLLSIATKVIVQQAVFTPVFNVYFFGMQALLSGDGIRGIAARTRSAVPESIVNSLKLWPAVTAFSFTFIQPQYRFLFSGGFATLWQTYLSYLNRREEVRAGGQTEESILIRR